MYICMQVTAYVYKLQACMYVCDGCVRRYVHICTHVVFLRGCMYVSMLCVCMYECMSADMCSGISMHVCSSMDVGRSAHVCSMRVSLDMHGCPNMCSCMQV